MIIYVTKYALTIGIKRTVAEVDTDGWARVGWMQSYSKHAWRATPAEAIARAEQMRTAKIASLRKQIAKLEAMTFTVPE